MELKQEAPRVQPLRKAIFLDRDGVINKREEPKDKNYGPNWYCLSWDDFEFLPGVFDAFKLITESEYLPVVVSNQSCIGKGYIEDESINDIFYMMSLIVYREVENLYSLDYYYCPHDTDQGCACRKPSPGMLYQAAINHNIDLSQSWMVGDSESDIKAGVAAGIKNLIYINSEVTQSEQPIQFSRNPRLSLVSHAPNFLEAVEYIIASTED